MQQDRAKTKKGNLKQPSHQDAINWVSKAWESIKLETLTHSFLVIPMLLMAPKMILHQMTSHQLKWIPKKKERAVMVRKMVKMKKLMLMS